MITKRKTLKGSAALFALAARCSQARATNTQGVKFGVIRWDAWDGQTESGEVVRANTGWFAAHNLDPANFHKRAPFFARQLGPNQMSIDGGTQTIMDQEITYAAKGFNNRHFWCFAWNASNSPYSIAFQLFQSSKLRDQVHYCLFFTPNTSFYEAVSAGSLIPYLKQGNYQTVLGGRPLIIYSVSGLVQSQDRLTSATSALKKGCTVAGVPAPYIVVMDMSHNMRQAAQTAANIGADAVTTYAAPLGMLNNTPYTTIDKITQKYWATMADAGAKMLPTAMSGWNRAPRIVHPVPWERRFGTQSITNVATEPSPAELASHVQSCIDFVDAHRHQCEANVALLYAWNEFDEGGFICPTWTANGADHAKLDALATVW
jgi:hypothetical protein